MTCQVYCQLCLYILLLNLPLYSGTPGLRAQPGRRTADMPNATHAGMASCGPLAASICDWWDRIILKFVQGLKIVDSLRDMLQFFVFFVFFGALPQLDCAEVYSETEQSYCKQTKIWTVSGMPTICSSQISSLVGGSCFWATSSQGGLPSLTSIPKGHDMSLLWGEKTNMFGEKKGEVL